MSLTPTDGPEIRDTDGQATSGGGARPSLTGRERIKSVVVNVQRRLGQRRRTITAAVRSGFNRLLSPGLSADEPSALPDKAVEPPESTAVDSLPARAFPLTYPTRSYRFVGNDTDLVAEADEETLRMFHPDGSEAWLRSDTWVEVEP